MIESGYLKHRCFSFANVQQIPGLPYYVPGAVQALECCINNKVGVFMDSGVVGWRSYRVSCQKKGNDKALAKLCSEEEFIQRYVDYVKANQQNWDFCMTIDLERVADKILQRHKKILAMGIQPVPVFHGDDSVDFIQKYADLGHQLIAIASWRTLRNGREQFRAYMGAAFNAAAKYSIKIHGLAFTAVYQLLEFPFFSADSSSWSRVAGFGGIMRFDPHKCRMTNINISTRETSTENLLKLNPKAMEAIKEEVASEGFDFELLREDFVQRHIWNAKEMQKLVAAAEKRHSSNGHSSGWNLLF